MTALKNNEVEKKYIKIVFIYAAISAVYICVAHAYTILNPELLLAGPVTGGLIVWVHLHTLGAITPLFMGIGFYNLYNRYHVQIKPSQILHHFLMLYIPLPFFLILVFHREGGLSLIFCAFLVFSSAVYYIYTFVKALRQVKKENRTFEFWTDAVSLYFLFQAVLFGFALAANLSFHFFRRDITHSIKLHSHSSIVGFWLLQFLNMVYRGMPNNHKNAKSAGRYTFLKYAVISSGTGIFLWTSVHDRFSWFFYVFYFSVGFTLVFLTLHLFKNKNTVTTNAKQAASRWTLFNIIVVLFLFTSFVLAGFMIYSGFEDFIFYKHLPFIYMYTIFYGVFVFIQMPFLASVVNTGTGFAARLKWAHGVYIILALLFVSSVIFENVLRMRLLQLVMLMDFIYIGYLFYGECEYSNRLIKSP
jgi:hypothetical protein